MREKIVLIDSNNIAYRAFYALPDTITTSSGIVTNAVLGFTNMVLKLAEDFKPDTIICAFDSKAPTFRHKMFDQYKIHRKKMPDELIHQIPLIKQVMKAFNIACIEKEGVEADDILASLAKEASGSYRQVIIVTGDKDMLQMVSDNIRVLSSRKSITDTIIYDRQGVKEKLGVDPGEIKDLLALMGDSSDNIPGISGIGPRTAVKLIKQFGSIESIFEGIDGIKSEKLKNLLLQNREIAATSKKLTTLKEDIKFDPLITDSSFKDLDLKKVKEIFEELEFRNLINRLPKYIGIMDFKIIKPEGAGAISKKISLNTFTSDIDFRKILGKNNNKVFIAAIEEDARIYALIIYFGGDRAYFVEKGTTMEKADAVLSLKNLLENRTITKTGIHFKAIMKFLMEYGISMEGSINDLGIMFLLLNPLKSGTDIFEISREIIKTEIDDAGSGSEGDINGDSTGDTRDRNMEDSQMSLDLEGTGINVDTEDDLQIKRSSGQVETALRTLAFYDQIEEKILLSVREMDLIRTYREIEEPLIKILADMEYIGVAIDLDYLGKLIKEYESEISRLTGEIHKLCGEDFNINSSQQLAEVLYKRLKLPALKKIKTGLSTDAATLKAIQHTSPVIGKILEYREKTKLKNTYIDVLPNLVHQEDGRVHTSYNQLGTSTGRMSSNNPNLQNIPVRTEYGKQIRKAFIPGKGYDLIMASDYSQIELRVLAHMSEDENLIESFNRQEDIHTRTASEIFAVDYNEVGPELRRKAKAINFGIIYGMTEFGLAKRLSISEVEARDYIDKYLGRYPGVSIFIKKLIEDACRNGYSTTMFGRKRYIKELGSSNSRIRSLGERFAVNTPIQGSAADIMKLSTTVLHNELRSGELDSNIILHVHDELVLELKEKDQKKIEEIVKRSMENCIKLRVGLKVDISTGSNWYI
ncbi:MAG: DNA polymerase I [Actinobacteria bacterium]|nr:DNA polymerase I [Actinomycetota bacterium]